MFKNYSRQNRTYSTNEYRVIMRYKIHFIHIMLNTGVSILTVSQQFHVDTDDIDSVSGTHIMVSLVSISTVSQQFHVDIDDIDTVSEVDKLQNFGVDIDSFTAVSRRYRRYRHLHPSWT